VHEPEEDLNLYIRLAPGERADPWVEENLPGVLDRCRAPEAVTTGEADEAMAALLDGIFGPPVKEVRSRPVIAGNSVHADWTLVRRLLPKLLDRVHYRLLDVTTVKLEWLRYWRGTGFDKENPAQVRRYFPGARLDGEIGPHDAYYDVQASIAELAYYRQRLQKKAAQKEATEAGKRKAAAEARKIAGKKPE
jgi:oligoribonuclease